MSTKTVLKRVALVAVAALAIGGVSAVSANAAYGTNLQVTTGYTGAASQAGTWVAGPANATSVTNTAANPEYVTISGGTFAGGLTSTTLAATNGSILINTPTVGTITVNGYSFVSLGQFSPTVTDQVVYTIVASSPVGVISTANSTEVVSTKASPNVLADSGSIVFATTAVSGDDAVLAAKGGAVPVKVAVIRVRVLDSQTVPAAVSTPVSATISGSGLILASAGGNTPGTFTGFTGSPAKVALASTNATSGDAYIAVYSDGTAGSGTITISAGTTVLGTKTVTFYGSSSAISASVSSTQIAVGGGNSTVTVTLKDSAGNLVANDTPVVTANNSTIATAGAASASSALGLSTFTITSAATTGVATFTVTNAAATATTTVTVNVSAAAASSGTLTFDKATYAPGEKMTLTLSLKDSAGNPIGDAASAALFATGGIVSNVALQGDSLTGLTASITNGVHTYTVYAPFAAGPITLSATMAAAGTYVAAAAAAAVLTASATVVADTAALDAANAAADAAAEATDAANAATDAANAAADAADSATSAAQDAADQAGQALAAVNTLATSVASLIAGIKAQLTSLTNLVVKLQASVAVLPKK